MFPSESSFPSPSPSCLIRTGGNLNIINVTFHLFSTASTTGGRSRRPNVTLHTEAETLDQIAAAQGEQIGGHTTVRGCECRLSLFLFPPEFFFFGQEAMSPGQKVSCSIKCFPRTWRRVSPSIESRKECVGNILETLRPNRGRSNPEV